MDQQQKTPTRPSGIPRLAASRLPLPTSSASRSIKPSPSREKLRADPGLDATRLRRPSEQPVLKKPPPKYPLSYRTPEKPRQKRDVSNSGLSDGGRSENAGDSLEEAPMLGIDAAVGDAERRGRPRPSLSERTIETLSRIPPSPGPSSRQSSFFNGNSPVRSPSRTPSAMTSRSPSRASTTRRPSDNDFLSQQASAIQLPSRSRISPAPSLSSNDASTGQRTSLAGTDIPSNLKKPSIRASLYNGVKDTTGKSPNPRPALGKTSANATFSDMGPPPPPLHVKKTRKSLANNSSPISNSRKPSTQLNAPDLSIEQQSEMEMRKASKSSSALRESIAKAKAARKASARQNNSQNASVDVFDNLNVEDPFNQKPKDSNNGLLRKRVEAGRISGHLNIAAMSLTEIPKEVMTMYDFDPNSTTDWYESVDLIKFIAADNEFVELSEAAFPDVDPFDIDSDKDERGNQFAGLEIMDLHGNQLRTLPMGFGRLQRIHTLNLSNNKLDAKSIQIVMQMEALKDLKLANNLLEGSFSSDVKNLTSLEILDLRGNSLTELPKSLEHLACLRILDVGDNQLTSLPFESLGMLPLKDLRAPRNKLAGTLIPASLSKLDSLQSLDVTGNALTAISEREDLEMPSLQTLSISMNRIKHLPNICTWSALLTLSAEDNSLPAIPQGFVELQNLRNVDFTGNNISKLDERIGLMENLSTLRLANNPLRERKFLTMNTDDIKRDLRNRCEPEPQDTDDEGSVATQFTLAPETPAQMTSWQVKPGGVLDRSYSEMSEVDVKQLERINFNDIRCLYLQHNSLTCIPVPALSMLAHCLTDLDLSNNPLDSSSVLSTSLTLPNLQILNLSAARLTTLEPILANLSAPSLTTLDVSYNRLSGPLPAVRQVYPNLMTFLAADNGFQSLEFEAVQGLQVLDVGNNNISSLPPKLGLLRAEGCSKNWGTGSPLRRFEVAGNSFRVPRWQVVAKGTDAILDWLKDRIRSEDLAEWEPDEQSIVQE
ncbi:hypothetical protein CNMCM6805_006432 [Aspergillus fumigatiaffinis]|uniref:Uncharacterized protein n=1 Tax=Aspergillus fumigatiaffinis TaxID=340414 RepID=A0A8H4GLW3_9EURO|nr:hypothetical protein CNMCM5878_006506 [Aspergillus fumigatiaffinis]KAF4224540.1 hypothetical protein CNMCM6457_009312 [Aspergillus fumigatiaffinis]KAF4238392.1 hypothetical protein CNMCM6805_006432 [Aspergillus fumigatiaffinis]